MYKRYIVKLILMLIIVFAISCEKVNNNDNLKDSTKLKIISSVDIVKEILGNIGGEFLTTEVVISPTSPPHKYSLNINDILKIESGDIIMYNGAYFEGRAQELFEKISKPHFSLLDNIPRKLLIFNDGKVNPHFWFDASLMQTAISKTADYLVEMNPINEIVYRKNEEFTLINLVELDIFIAERLENIEKRFIVTNHNAFSYFGKRYGFETFAIQKVYGQTEISYLDLKDAADFIMDNDIEVIFGEKNMPRRSLLRLIETLKERGYDVKVGGYLYTDSLMNLSYIDMMKANVDTIYSALSNNYTE